MKKILSVLLLTTLLTGLFSISASANTGKLFLQYDGQVHLYKGRYVTVVIDGHEVQTGDMPAIIMDRSTLVPAREVFESDAFNANVEWNGEKQEVYIAYQDTLIVMKINSNIALVNNKEVEMAVPAKLIKDTSKDYAKTMIPLRFVSENFNYNVDWDGENYKAILNSPGTDNNGEEDQTDNNNGTDDNQNTDINEDGDSGAADSVQSGSAKRPLPTPLKDNPIKWIVNSAELEEIAKKYIEDNIKEENHPTTDITNVEYYKNNIEEGFLISATSPISSIEQTLWDQKLILDINNANWKIDKYEQSYDDNSLVHSVRSSQYSNSPKVTRVVFDLKDEGLKYNISLSDDRKTLNVKALSNTIFEIDLGQNAAGDYIKVHGFKAPDVKAFRLSNPDRIVFDLPNTNTVFGYKSGEAEGQYVTAIRSAQFNETTTRIVIETDGQADYQVYKDSQSATVIQIIEPSYNNFQYQNAERPTIKLKKTGGLVLDTKGILHNDIYLDNEYILTLPGDYTSLYGKGEVKINDGNIESISIDNNDKGNTRLTIKQSNLYTYKVTEDESYIYIKAYKPKEVYSKIIVVDAGHGKNDPGANANGLYEKNINLDMVKYLKSYLDQDSSIKAYYTRLDDSYPTLKDRTDLANAVGADLFLSVHNNAYFSSHYGTETLYYPNCPSGPSGLTSKQFASIFQGQLVSQLGTKNRGLKSRDNLFVLKHTNMPSIIVEVAFLTNNSDAAKLKDTNFKKKASKALYDAIVETFNKYPTGR